MCVCVCVCVCVYMICSGTIMSVFMVPVHFHSSNLTSEALLNHYYLPDHKSHIICLLLHWPFLINRDTI